VGEAHRQHGTRACPSCGAPRTGPYCAACGERFLEPEDLRIGHFLLHELPHELLHVDGKLPRTLWSLCTRPGAMAADFVAGRRNPYFGPLRTYLAVYLLVVLAGALFGAHERALPILERAHDIDPTGLLERLIAARGDLQWSSPELRTRLAERARIGGELGTVLIFLGVAVVQSLVLWSTRRRFLEHVVLGLTVASFYLALMLIASPLIALAGAARYDALALYVQQALAITALPIYWWIAIRRFYALRPWPAALAAVLITLGHMLVAVTLNVIFLAALIASA
jgi:hypothetical protein